MVDCKRGLGQQIRLRADDVVQSLDLLHVGKIVFLGLLDLLGCCIGLVILVHVSLEAWVDGECRGQVLACLGCLVV